MKSQSVRSLSLIAALAALAAFAAAPAQADEALFGYMYSTDSLPKGTWEYEQIHTLRTGKARGGYTSIDLRNEIETGITDNLSAALYVNSSFLHQSTVYDPEDVTVDLDDHDSFNVNGVSLEFKYRLLSPYTDPIGLSLYAEPEIEIRDAQTGDDAVARALEFRLILQKNFMDDLITVASNLMFEPEWEKVDGATLRELWAEFTLGASYRLVPNWWVGLEFRNHREFPDMDFGKQEHSAYFLGPTVHYGQKEWWATLTLLPQITGHPRVLGTGSDGNPVDGGSLHLGQHEKFEARLKVGINL